MSVHQTTENDPSGQKRSAQRAAGEGGAAPASADIRRDLDGYLEIARRRKWHIVLPAMAVFTVVALVAFAMPSIYRSTATIAIEEPEIPTDTAQGANVGYADQRIHVITQQLMTRANLWRIVEKFDLYSDVRKQEPSEAVLDTVRRNIKLEIVNAEAAEARSSGKTAAPIAFTLAFDAEAPETAQHVANELASLYLNENTRRRQQRTSEAASFFAEEAKKHSETIAQLERTLATFKERNISRLPEWQALNMQMRDRTENEILEAERQIRSMEERKFYLEGQLALVKPNTPVFTGNGERILDADERLKQLQAQVASAQATYSAQHPDLVKMNRELEALKKQTAASGATTRQAAEVTRVRNQLAEARERYSENHPDVVKLKRSLAALESTLVADDARPEAQVQARHPENPAYIALQSQLEGTKTELKAVRIKQSQLRGRVNEIGVRLAQTPQVERQYLDLSRERENEVKRYQEVKAKQMQAEAAEELEKDRKGERFSLVEPAQLPEHVQRPNRKAILLVGFIFSIGLGLGLGALAEMLDQSVRGPRALRHAFNAPVLGVIPFLGDGSGDPGSRHRGAASAAAD